MPAPCRRALRGGLLLALLAGCSSPSEGPCGADDPAHPALFAPCPGGGGDFGSWIVDAHGLPAFAYTLPEDQSPLAHWWNTEGRTRTDHWHQLGNGSLIALAFNEGNVQVLDQLRAPIWLNYPSEPDHNYGGGFAYIEEGGKAWSTAYRWRPPGAVVRRFFGMGYFETEMAYGGLRVVRTVLAPLDGTPALLAETRIENETSRPRDLTVHEYWDVGLQPLRTVPIASGVLKPGLPSQIDRDRSAFMDHYVQEAEVRSDLAAAVVTTRLVPGSVEVPAAGSASDFDPSPDPLFLAPLAPDSGGRFSVDQEGFFGPGGAGAPALRGVPLSGPVESPGAGEPLALFHARPVALPPGGAATLRYAFGLLRPGVEEALARWRMEGDPAGDLAAAWKKRLLYFAPDRDPVLHRELAWDAYYLQSASTASEFFRAPRVVQGGAYLYRHGMDGVPGRDYALFTLPLVYLDADLARGILRTMMETTQPDGQILYGIGGSGVPFGAPIHASPSDLDLFLLWALTEYLLGTRDFAFLAEPVPYYDPAGLPAATQATVLDHARLAVGHLFDAVGTGPHGLLRIRDGDWNDGIIYFSKNLANVVTLGESNFNTALALFVLPRAEAWLASSAPDAAARIEAALPPLRRAFAGSWTGSWFLRGWDGSGNPIGEDRLFQEPQSLAILADAAPDPRGLLETLERRLVDPSPIGAVVLDPPSTASSVPLPTGTDVNGGVWAAMNGILTWAQGTIDPALGWQGLLANTLDRHAHAYPGIWYGIWSGPDAYNSLRSTRPGETFAHFATPGTDFPVMNANLPMGSLLAAIKLAGIEPTLEGLRLSPHLPLVRWSLATPLLAVSWGPKEISGRYTARVAGTMRLTIDVPWGGARVEVGGAPIPSVREGAAVSFDLPLTPGTPSIWSLRPAP